MTRSASQRCIHRKTQRKRFAAHRKKSAPSPRRRRLIRQKGRVDDTLRALLRVLSTPHRHTGGVFASCVFHSHHTSTFPSSLLLRSRHDSSTDDAAGADQGSARRRDFSRREGFHQADYVFQTGSHQKCGMARRARRRGMWIVTVSFHFAVCAFVSDTRLLETS